MELFVTLAVSAVVSAAENALSIVAFFASLIMLTAR